MVQYRQMRYCLNKYETGIKGGISMSFMTKRILCMLAAASLTVCALPQYTSGSARIGHVVYAVETEGDFSYSVNPDGQSVTVTKYAGSEAQVVIPDQLGGLPVTAIGRSAFFNRKELTTVTIPDGVTSIGETAFCNCRQLTSITIPESVTWFGDSAFSGTIWLTAKQEENPIIIINSVLVDGSTYSGNLAVPDGVTGIGCGAFDMSEGLTSITIPDSVTIIGDLAFANCSVLTSIVIPDSVTSIGSSAFYECSSLKDVTIPESVTILNDWLFCYCSSLKSITIPDHVTSIGDFTFGFCYGLTSITIPDNVNAIASQAFINCISLTDIQRGEGNQQYSSADGVLLTKDQKQIVCYPGGKTDQTYVIPERVTNIGDYAFSRCKYLAEVTVPDSVTVIGKGAFSNCTGLKTVTVMNPACVIFNASETVFNRYDESDGVPVYDGKICGYSDSTAKTYAANFGYTFEALPDAVLTTTTTAAITTTETTTTQPAASNEDDFNEDGTLSAADAVLLARYMAEDHELPAEQLDMIRNAKADQDGDGCITLLDLMKLIKKITSSDEG